VGVCTIGEDLFTYRDDRGYLSRLNLRITINGQKSSWLLNLFKHFLLTCRLRIIPLHQLGRIRQSLVVIGRSLRLVLARIQRVIEELAIIPASFLLVAVVV
jgi:hypothetical protein